MRRQARRATVARWWQRRAVRGFDLGSLVLALAAPARLPSVELAQRLDDAAHRIAEHGHDGSRGGCWRPWPRSRLRPRRAPRRHWWTATGTEVSRLRAYGLVHTHLVDGARSAGARVAARPARRRGAEDDGEPAARGLIGAPASARCATLAVVSAREPEAARLPPSGLVVHLLGRPRIEVDGAPGYRYRSRKSWALLAFLLLGERPPTRSQLASLLFAEADDPLGALRWCLAEIRRALGPAAAVVDGDPVRISLPEGTTVDVDVLVARPLDRRGRAPGPRRRPARRVRHRSTPTRSSRGCCPSDDGWRRPPSRSSTRQPWGCSREGTSTGRASWPSGPP